MHGVTKPLNCVRSSITPEKLPPEGKKTIVRCAWRGQAIRSVCSQSHCRSYSQKERRLSSSVYEDEKPNSAFFNHHRNCRQCDWQGQAINFVRSQLHYRSDSPKERRLSSSVHRVEKPFCAFFNHIRQIVAGRKEDNRPVRMARSSHSFCVFPVTLQKL